MTPPPLIRDISWLHTRLEEAITETARADVIRMREVAEAMLGSGVPDPTLAELANDRIDAILKLASFASSDSRYVARAVITHGRGRARGTRTVRTGK